MQGGPIKKSVSTQHLNTSYKKNYKNWTKGGEILYSFFYFPYMEFFSFIICKNKKPPGSCSSSP